MRRAHCCLCFREQQGGLRAVPGRHRHHGGGGEGVDLVGEEQHRIPTSLPAHIRAAQTQVSTRWKLSCRGVVLRCFEGV